MRVSMRRQSMILALLGPQGSEEMRLTRLSGADLRKDPAALIDAVKAQGFFPGQRVVFLEDAADGLTKTIAAALQDWQQGDAQIIVTAGQLRASSNLRKTFETHPNTYAIAIYDDPPSQAEIAAELQKAGLQNLGDIGLKALSALARELEPGDFRQTLEKLALYKLHDATPLGLEDIQNCAPNSQEAALDDILWVVSEGRAEAIGPLMQRLKSQGMQPVTLCISAVRHFKILFSIASDPAGASAGISKLRPPVFGPRRDRFQRSATRWSLSKSKMALQTLTDLDLQLRSANQHAPALELVERALIRLAMAAQK
jgi:DNA polymerase-3 subunit delta